MQILITGATGLIGCRLTRHLLAQQHEITILTRSPERAQQRLGSSVTCWSSLTAQRSLDGFQAVINLAGESIAEKRWSKAQKQRLCQSRWEITENLSRLINASAIPPAVFISASAISYYGDQGEQLLTEETPPRDGFTHQLCAHWEALAQRAATSHTRVCLLRTGVVLAPEGGALAKLLPLYRLGLGGPIATGTQYFPWIHIDDMVSGIDYLLQADTLSGPFNLVAPGVVSNQQFTTLLAQALGRSARLRIPAFVLRFLLGEAAVLLLGSQHTLPQRLEQAGFPFRFPELAGALQQLLHAEQGVKH